MAFLRISIKKENNFYTVKIINKFCIAWQEAPKYIQCIYDKEYTSKIFINIPIKVSAPKIISQNPGEFGTKYRNLRRTKIHQWKLE